MKTIILNDMQVGYILRLIEADSRTLGTAEEDFLNALHRALSVEGQRVDELSQSEGFIGCDIRR